MTKDSIVLESENNAHAFCQKCLKTKDFWAKDESTENQERSTNFVNQNLNSRISNPYMNKKIIINADFNFPKKGEDQIKESKTQNS